MLNRRYIIIIGMLIFLASAKAQNEGIKESLSYRAEAFGSAATGSYTPFWLMSNQYGVVPSEAGNGYLRAALFQHQSFGKNFYWGAGLDAVVAAPRYRNVYIQQLFAEIGYQSLVLSVGSREQWDSLFDRELSSGDMIRSANARPIPEVKISIPRFTNVPYTKGWLQLKGSMAVGHSFDDDFLQDFMQSEQYYTADALWHHKSIHFQIKDTRNGAPFSVAFGLQHIAQWGGTSSDPKLGKQPQSIKDFVRVFFGKSGDEKASISDQVNVLGNHHISYDLKLSYSTSLLDVHAYYQHLSADKSGLLLYNMPDGLWGLQADLHNFPWIRKVVVEYVPTNNQSGPFHFIDFDHSKHPGRGGGGDNYYNNQEYTTGLSYFNQAIGSPLLPSPVYNEDGTLGFLNTRMKAWHIGLSGDLSTQLSYRLLLTGSEGWGTPYKPFFKKRSNVSCGLDLNYRHPKLSDWDFKASIGTDTGDMYGDKTFGVSLGVRKQGIIR